MAYINHWRIGWGKASMKRLFSRIPSAKLRQFTLWLDRTIDNNAGWLIVLAIVFFGLANLSFQRDNRTIIENTKNAAVAAAQAAEDTKNILAGQSKAVDALIADNEQQTRILCRLILRGDLDLDPNEEAEIERICQEEIDNQTSSNDPEPPLPTNSSQNQGSGQSSSPQATPSNPSDNNQNAPEEPSGIRRVPLIDGLLNFIGL